MTDRYSVVVRDHDGRDITPVFTTEYDPGIEFASKFDNLAISQHPDDLEKPSFVVFETIEGSVTIRLADIGSIRALRFIQP